MTEQDRAVKKAEELLPDMSQFSQITNPANYRSVVAAELRKMYAEIERLQKIHSAEGTFRCTCNSYPHSPNCGLDERLISQQAEITRMRAELARVKP